MFLGPAPRDLKKKGFARPPARRRAPAGRTSPCGPVRRRRASRWRVAAARPGTRRPPGPLARGGGALRLAARPRRKRRCRTRRRQVRRGCARARDRRVRTWCTHQGCSRCAGAGRDLQVNGAKSLQTSTLSIVRRPTSVLRFIIRFVLTQLHESLLRAAGARRLSRGDVLFSKRCTRANNCFPVNKTCASSCYL